MVYDIVLLVLLALYTGLVLYLTKYVYLYGMKKGLKEQDALYYNRKFVHIFAGGIVALFVPFFQSPIYPLIAGFTLASITFLTHERGERLYWFQNSKDFNDVTFCIMWGASIFIIWFLTNSAWLAILPALYMAFGDGITGIIRNAFFGERSKHYIGNVFMAAACLPLGYLFGSLAALSFGGIISAFLASAIEHFEFGPIDDNILITVSASITILIVYHIEYGIIFSF